MDLWTKLNNKESLYVVTEQNTCNVKIELNNCSYCTETMYFKLAARKTSMLTFSGKRHARFLITIWPAVLNALFGGTEVATTDKYFLASWERRGYLPLADFHHSNGSQLLSWSSLSYLWTSLMALSAMESSGTSKLTISSSKWRSFFPNRVLLIEVVPRTFHQ